MTVTLMQTADAIFYYPMLQETARTVRAFCARNGYAYSQFVGIKRGHMPWQASYNRVYMLKEMVDQGAEGWVFYLDADAFIQDLEFDLSAYLQKRSHAAAIFAGYSVSDIPYDINSGGFAVNLSHPIAKAIILDWHRLVTEVSSETFDAAVHWESDLANDQHMLVKVLRNYIEDIGLAEAFIFERANESYVNNGPFVSQLLRSFYPTFAERLAAIKERVADVMRGRRAVYGIEEGPGVFMRAQHPKLLTSCGRKTPFGILSRGQAGGLMFGPYIPLAAGRYVVRIFGKVTVAAGQDRAEFISDIATEKGFQIHARHEQTMFETTRGVVGEYIFELLDDADDLEVRIMIGPNIDIAIHALKIVKAEL